MGDDFYEFVSFLSFFGCKKPHSVNVKFLKVPKNSLAEQAYAVFFGLQTGSKKWVQKVGTFLKNDILGSKMSLLDPKNRIFKNDIFQTHL